MQWRAKMTLWADKIISSATKKVEGTPSFPPPDVQERFVGRSGEAALQEVRPFYELIANRSSLTPESTVVDFGAGWGRIARFFEGDMGDCANLHLVDVDPEALEWCKKCGVKGNPNVIIPTGSLPFADQSTDVLYAYSVFSHLSENSAIHWLTEIARVLKPDGLFVFTTQSLRFLDLVRACFEKVDPNSFEERIGRYMGDPYKALDRFKNGQFAYSDVDGVGGGGVLSGEFYGWAALPVSWFTDKFGVYFEILDYIDDPAYFEQAVFVLRKRPQG